MKKTEKNISTSSSSPDDITQCYGISCETCRKECLFKTAGLSVITEERHAKNVAKGATRIYNFKEEFQDEFCHDFSASPASPGTNILRLFYWSLKSAPRGTMAILERAFEGRNQSDVARSRGTSRQAVSKLYKADLATLAKLLGVRQPNLPESRLWNLTPLEFQIMQLVHSDPNISERKIAAILDKNQTAIHRAKASALYKMNHNSPSKRPSKRITAKAN